MTTMTAPTDALEAYLDTYRRPDFAAMEASIDGNIRWLNEMTGQWERGREPLVANTRASMEGTTDFRVDSRDTEVITQTDDVAVVSTVLLFGGVYGGQAWQAVCPTTFVLRRVGDEWIVAYQHALEFRPRAEG